MAGVSVKLVKEYIEAQGYKIEQAKEELLYIEFGFEGGKIHIFMDFADDENVHLEGMRFINVPENKLESMYKAVNECNDMYRHIKFVVDVEHKQIVARDDAIIQIDTCGPECFQLLGRMVGIVEAAYPMLMKAIWG